MEHLVSPYQQCFIQGRRIYQDILEYFTSLEMSKQAESRAADGKVILVVDFNKAHIEPQKGYAEKEKKKLNAVSSHLSQFNKVLMRHAVSISPQ